MYPSPIWIGCWFLKENQHKHFIKPQGNATERQSLCQKKVQWCVVHFWIRTASQQLGEMLEIQTTTSRLSSKMLEPYYGMSTSQDYCAVLAIDFIFSREMSLHPFLVHRSTTCNHTEIFISNHHHSLSNEQLQLIVATSQNKACSSLRLPIQS